MECMKSLLVGKSIQDVKKCEELSRSAIDFFGWIGIWIACRDVLHDGRANGSKNSRVL